MSGLNDRISKQARVNHHRASRETFGFDETRKRDLREMLREAVENTAKQQEEPKDS